MNALVYSLGVKKSNCMVIQLTLLITSFDQQRRCYSDINYLSWKPCSHAASLYPGVLPSEILKSGRPLQDAVQDIY